MKFVYCLECGAKISARAKACPMCGSPTDDGMVSLIPQNNGLIRLESGSPTEFGEFLPLSPIQKENVHRLFGIAENLARIVPSLFQVIQAQFPNVELVADLTPEIQKLLASGEYTLQRKKTGELLAHIVTKTGKKITKNITLVEKTFAPDLAPSISNLQMQMQMMQIMDKLKDIEKSVLEVAEGLHDDRLAQLESAWAQYRQAIEIDDANIRNQKLLLIQSQASEAKFKLMRELSRNKRYFDKKRSTSTIDAIIKAFQSNASEEKSKMGELRTNLLAIIQATRLETLFTLIMANKVQQGLVCRS